MNYEDFIRPSAVKSLAACPGSARMQAEVVNQFYTIADDGQIQESEAPEATIGTQVHAIAADSIERWKAGAEWGDAIAEALNVGSAVLGRWDLLCAQRCCEFARDLINKHGIEPDNVLSEHRLAMGAFGIPRGGTADLVLVIPNKLVIVTDFKAGFNDQGDATEHDQLAVYACAAAETFMAKQAIVYLFQARMDKHLRASAATFDLDAIKKNRAWTNAVVNLARGSNPELKAGFDQCEYCKALTHCAQAEEYIVNTLDALDVIGSPSDPDAWGDLVSVVKLAEKRAKGLSDLAKEHLNGGGEITGWKLAAGRAITSIDAAKAIKIAKENGQLDNLLEFASIKAEAAKVVPGLEECTFTKTSAPSLKPDRSAEQPKKSRSKWMDKIDSPAHT